MAGVNITYSLECGHAALAPATLVSGKLYCPWHDEYSIINGVIEYEWRSNCQSCPFARWAGQSKTNAEIFSNGHVRRNTGHNPIAEYTINPDARRTAVKFKEWRIGEQEYGS